MTRDRGFRRAQEERLYNKRKNYRHQPDSPDFKRKRETCNCADTIGRRKSDIINNPKKCSCSMCGNPRNNQSGNSWEGKTMPERKFIDRANFEEGK